LLAYAPMTTGLLRGTVASTSQSRGAAGAQMDPPFFDDFDLAESTYDVDAIQDQGNVEYGWEANHLSNVFHYRNFKPERWFYEAPSGGHASAWQTFYPAQAAVTRLGRSGNWKNTPEGWVLPYARKPSRTDPQLLFARRAPDWFDSSVNQYDIYGRQGQPAKNGLRREDENGYSWIERTINTTLACPTVNCKGVAFFTGI